jgi:hypothetical protein
MSRSVYQCKGPKQVIMARRNWLELDGYVDRRIGQGASYSVIAGELGVTPSAIAGRMHRRRVEPAMSKSDQLRAAEAVRSVEQSLGYERVTQGGCRWVIGDPKAKWQWCGKPVVRGPNPYCAEHAATSRGRL